MEKSHTEEEEEEKEEEEEEEEDPDDRRPGEGNSDDASSSSLFLSSSHFAAALPGLPDEIGILCIARVPSIAQIWGVSRAWRRIVASSVLFQSVRRDVGLAPPQWLYALLKTPCSSTSFEWHAYDPLARTWHPLPPLPIPIAFHLSSPSFIGHTYAVQCAASATRLFMVAACRLGTATSQSSHVQVIQEPSSQCDLQKEIHVDDQIQLGGLQGENEMQSGAWQGQNQVQSCEGLTGQLRMHSNSPPVPALQRLAQPRASLEPALPCPLVFNTISKSWSFSSPLFYGPRCWCATGVDSGGKLYVASGSGKLWDINMSKSAEMYDPERDTWTLVERLRSSKFSGEAITAVNYEGKLHMVSGRGVFKKVGVVYDADLKRWMDMPNGMRAGWNGACVVVDGTLLAVDKNMGRIRIYQSAGDRWGTLVEHPMLKGLEQVIAAPGNRICGIMEGLHGRSCDSDRFHERDFVRIVRLSPSPADSEDSHVSCELSFIDIATPVPNVSIVALQVLSSMLSPSPISFS